MQQVNWFDLEEADRIKNVYSQFTIADFWQWWSNGERKFMEVRIKDFSMIKRVSNVLHLPYSASGVFVCNPVELKNVIAMTRDEFVMWFGVNPRKKNWNKWGNKSLGGTDANVESIDYVFVDIDRSTKVGEASSEDLKNCDKLANEIIDKLTIQKWSNNYIKICSGNGVQLLFKLDFSILMPNVDFQHLKDKKQCYIIETKQFSKIKTIVKNGIGKQILKFSRKYEKELNVSVDKTGFNIGRVAALPFTKNHKFGSFTWRGIVEMKSGVNDGLSDYILSVEDDYESFTKKEVFVKPTPLDSNNRIKKGKLCKNKLAAFLLNNDFPRGGINNSLWFQLKCLLRDSKFDTKSEEFRDYHNKIKVRHQRTFSVNTPEKKFTFEESSVNNFCINNCLPPVYELWKGRNKRLDMKLDSRDWWDRINDVELSQLPETTEVLEDFEATKKLLREGDYNNVIIIASLLKGLIMKYGEKDARYYSELFYKYFSYE